jgi:hypothetical protein
MDPLLFVGQEVKPIPSFPENSGTHALQLYHLTLKVSQRLIIFIVFITTATLMEVTLCIRKRNVYP